jgi:hypothetical protein
MIDRLAAYNVTWDSPSTGPSGSMPIGNGDLGANVWVEPSGDLVLLIGKTDAWDENSINLKLGRVRVKCTPNPFALRTRFKQTLHLNTADIEIIAGPIKFRIWADANHPVIRIEAESDDAFEIEASLEMWRTEPRQIKTQTGDIFRNLTGKDADPCPTIIWPDQVLSEPDRIIWCHHNEKRQHDGYEINMRLQGLGGFLDKMPHPLLARTFGGAMLANGCEAVDDTTLKSIEARRSHRVTIVGLTIHPGTVEHWCAKLDEIISGTESQDPALARAGHELWWKRFWSRSWIFIDSPDAFHVTQGYVLQRFMNACAGRGASPIKFNGSIFTYGKDDDPDFRRWGGPGFWFMNSRLIYWPMLAAGDFDLMLPWLRMFHNQLPLQKHRTKTYYNHGGAHYPETIMFWGAEVSAHYGWTPFEQRTSPEAECEYIRYYWSGGIELTLILLEYYQHTGDEQFARELLLPIADAVTAFFDLHYQRDESGKIRFDPAQALETWHEAVNPLPELAGLNYVLPRLTEAFAVSEKWSGVVLNSQQRGIDYCMARWKRMLDELPAIPVGERSGKRVILPAEQFDKKKNTENPELYCVFPYRLYGLEKPDLELARDTFATRLHPAHACWSQDDVQMALLGLSAQAKQHVINRAAPESHSDSRFPGFWNAFHDWIPDMDHGGVLQLALQSMLMQCSGRDILLLPAWPDDWDADFKLHAPGETTVEAKVRAGRIAELKVMPVSRHRDVRVWQAAAAGTSP